METARQQRDVRQYGISAAVLIFLGLVIGAFGALWATGGEALAWVLVALGVVLVVAAVPMMQRYSRAKKSVDQALR